MLPAHPPRLLHILSLGLLTVVITSGARHSAAQSPPANTFLSGIEIFQHEWEFEQQPQPVIPDDLAQQIRMRQSLLQAPGDGLGPMHNATSCEACHAAGGGAGVEHNVTLLTLDPRNSFLIRNLNSQETRQRLIDLYPGLISPVGLLSLDVVVHEKSARPFYDGIRSNLAKWIPIGASDEWFVSEQRTIDAIAERPVLAGRFGDLDFYLSQRNSPPLFGLGLIDRIEISRLSTIARSQARRSDGQITGRIGVGKFGWRGQTATLDAFVRGACAGELGLQVARTPQPADAADETYISFGLDLQETEVNMLVNYVRSLPAPRQQTELPSNRAMIREGKQVFAKIGCATCHVEHVYPARGIYSDLLLHDMGDLLQAPSPAPLGITLGSASRMALPRFPNENGPTIPSQFRFSIGGYYGSPSSATPQPYFIQRPDQPQFPRGKVPEEYANATDIRKVTWDTLQGEWRTPPLWGVADSGPYLHDGRAKTLDAAIRWHAGEAAQSASQYRTLTPEGREKVVTFLASLRAPVESLWTPVDTSTRPTFVAEANGDIEIPDDFNVFDPF